MTTEAETTETDAALFTIKLHNLEIIVSGIGVRANSAGGGVLSPAANFDRGEVVARHIREWAEVRTLRRLHEEEWRVQIEVDEDADTSWMDHAADPEMDCDEDHSGDPQYNVSIVRQDDWEPLYHLASIGGVHMGPEGRETGIFPLSEVDIEGDYITGLVDDMLSEAEEIAISKGGGGE